MPFVLSLLLIAIGVLVLTRSIFIASKDERLVVYRAGSFFRVCEPGLYVAIPFLDEVVRMNLRSELPGWQVMSPEQFEAAIREASSRKLSS